MADLACVLYNVQSNARVEGVYRVLDILLEHKSPDTWCGVVRNAYRPDQALSIHQLRDLPALKFDMLTTLVIGNRFTRRKREWIFTPRGYNDWAGDQESSLRLGMPTNAVWLVFSGTADGNALARQLVGSHSPLVVSTASEYGGELARESCPGVTVWAGRQGVESRVAERCVEQVAHGQSLMQHTPMPGRYLSNSHRAARAELRLPYLQAFTSAPSSLELPRKRRCYVSRWPWLAERAISLVGGAFFSYWPPDRRTWRPSCKLRRPTGVSGLCGSRRSLDCCAGPLS